MRAKRATRIAGRVLSPFSLRAGDEYYWSAAQYKKNALFCPSESPATLQNGNPARYRGEHRKLFFSHASSHTCI